MTPELLTRVAARELAAAAVLETPAAARRHGVRVDPLRDEPLLAALPGSHRYARAEAIGREVQMVKISDKTDYSRFARPTSEDEGIWLDHVEVHLVTHPAGQVKEMHVHDPPQDHVIVMRSGRMRWTVEDRSLDAGPGDVIVTPAGVAHGYEVLGNEPARVVCIDSPTRPKPD